MNLLSPIPYRLIRIALGGVFLYSGISKVLELGYFSEVINAFGLLPSMLTYPAGVVIVIAELVLGFGIILDRRGALGGLLVMLLGFMAVAGYAIFMGYDIDCGCFGPGEPEAEAFSSLRSVILRDAVMVAGIAYLYLWRWKTGTSPRSFLSGAFPPLKLIRKYISRNQHDAV